MKFIGYLICFLGRKAALAVLPLLLLFNLYGCTELEIGGWFLGSTVAGGSIPGSEIDQTYYLGVFDPQEQIPPEVYRIRVHGQASFISRVKFASGWVKADLIDSLGSDAGLDLGNCKNPSGNTCPDQYSTFKTGRKLMLFGPEGFREAPKDHRLVIVMGASPEKFFSAVDGALGVMAGAEEQKRASELNIKLFEVLAQTRAERERVEALEKDIEVEMSEDTGVN